MRTIPLADAPALRGARRGTFTITAALALLVVGAVVAFVLCRETPAHAHDRAAAVARRHDPRARSVREHLLRHVLPHRRHARSALAERQPPRARRVLGPGVRGVPARHACGRPGSVRPVLHAAEAAGARLCALVSGQPVAVDLHGRHEDLRRSRPRTRHRARGRPAGDRRSRQRPRRRSGRSAAARVRAARVPPRSRAGADHRAQPVARRHRALHASALAATRRRRRSDARGSAAPGHDAVPLDARRPGGCGGGRVRGAGCLGAAARLGQGDDAASRRARGRARCAGGPHCACRS